MEGQTVGDERVMSREVAQVLRDIALGVREMHRAGLGPWGELRVVVDDWVLELACDSDGLSHCQHCTAPDGRVGATEHWQRYGTGPVNLLSTWELQQLNRLLGV